MSGEARAPEPEGEGLDVVLDRLEREIARLADGSRPLDQLVEAHEEAQRLIDTAQARLRELLARLESRDSEDQDRGQGESGGGRPTSAHEPDGPA